MTRRWLTAFATLLLAACQTTADPAALPTVLDLDAISTDNAATAMAIASPTRRPLPPTFTPSPTFTAVPTDPGVLPSPTPEGFRAAGTIYYIFNGDAIVELAADGSFEDLLPIPHIGQPITGLSASLDADLLAYIAPGAGSARELYVTDRSGSSPRQVSNLGFSEMQRPVWTTDGSRLAFITAQAPGAPMSIYMVTTDGIEQQPVIQLPSTSLRDLSWGPEDSWLFFSDNQIFAVDVFTGELFPALTQLTGFGPDFSPVHSPTQPELYYLKTRQDLETGLRGGVLSHIVTSDFPEFDIERPGAALYVDELEYSPDGAYLLAAGRRGVWVQTQAMQTATQVASDLGVHPQPTFSPDSEMVAYVDTDALGIAQIFVVNRRGGEPTQITFHQEGSITDLVWLAG